MSRDDLTAKNAKALKRNCSSKRKAMPSKGRFSMFIARWVAGFRRRFIRNVWKKNFDLGKLPFEAQKELVLPYTGEQLAQTYKPDFICYGKIIVELKTVKEIAPEHKAQLLNYLNTTGLELGLFVNFGAYPKTEIARITNTNFCDFHG